MSSRQLAARRLRKANLSAVGFVVVGGVLGLLLALPVSEILTGAPIPLRGIHEPTPLEVAIVGLCSALGTFIGYRLWRRLARKRWGLTDDELSRAFHGRL